MWKYLLLLFLLLFAGCREKPEPAPESIKNALLSIDKGSNLQAPYEEWTKRYGDSDVAALGFNLRILLEASRRHEVAIRDLQKKLTEKKKKKGWF